MGLKILITGGAGVVGSALARHLLDLNYDVLCIDCMAARDVVPLDLTDKVDLDRFLSECEPQVVIHLAALKNISKCEQDPLISRVINYDPCEQIARYCASHGRRLIYFSSDYVFPSSRQAWSERSDPDPSVQYGKDKLDCENYIAANLNGFAIIRTAQVYGYPGDFPSKVGDALRTSGVFDAYDNLANCPTNIEDLLCMIEIILKRSLTGIFHCVGPELKSRYDFALSAAKAIGFPAAAINRVSLESHDIRPEIVCLDGTATYDRLAYRPRNLEYHLHIPD